MNSKQLAEFYGISTQAVNRWLPDKTNRKTIQAEADVTPLEWQLVGEIAQLCYLYNAQGWEGAQIKSWAWLSMGSFDIQFTIRVLGDAGMERFMEAEVSNTAEMQLIKMQLDKLVYGDEK